jgi:biopolymer transport protein ExbD
MGISSSGGAPQINVTPLIDVLLVLLVIFLVIIPVMQNVETVDLPPNEQGEPTTIPIVIKLRVDATATIDEGAPLMAADLLGRLKPRVKGGSTVFVDFEDGVAWSDVIGTVDGVRGLVGDPTGIHVAVRIHE